MVGGWELCGDVADFGSSPTFPAFPPNIPTQQDRWQRVCPQVKGDQTEGIALSSTHSCDQLTPIVNLKRDGRVGGLRNGACALLYL